jgi:hypothetical protein
MATEPKGKVPRDDPGQSQRFIDTAREIGADANEEEFERAFKAVVPRRKDESKSSR